MIRIAKMPNSGTEDMSFSLNMIKVFKWIQIVDILLLLRLLLKKSLNRLKGKLFWMLFVVLEEI